MSLRAAGTLAVAVLLVGVDSGVVGRGASLRPRASVASLAVFTLVPPAGIALWIHPTAAPITVSVAADGRLKACEVGTTFSHYWRSGCRLFVGGSVTLPTSGGAMHVGFRIVPLGGRAIRVQRLRVQWHCVDHFFLLQRGNSNARLDAPVVLDC